MNKQFAFNVSGLLPNKNSPHPNQSVVYRSIWASALFQIFLTLGLILSWLAADFPILACFAMSVSFFFFVKCLALNLAWPTTGEKFLAKLFVEFVIVCILAFAIIYQSEGIISSAGTSHSFTDAIYFSVTTWTTLGYGDFTAPENLRLITSFEALLGLITFPMGTALMWFWCTNRSESNFAYIKRLRRNRPKDYCEWYDKQYLTGGRAEPIPTGKRSSTIPIFAAAEIGEPNALLKFIQRGDKVNQHDPQNDNWTPLSIAAAEGHFDCVKVLLENGADPNLTNKFGRTPLMYAITYGYINIAELLIEHRADINSPDSVCDLTPLASAACRPDREMVELLIRRGADPRYKNNAGMTAEDYAIREKRKEIAQILNIAEAKLNLLDSISEPQPYF